MTPAALSSKTVILGQTFLFRAVARGEKSKWKVSVRSMTKSGYFRVFTKIPGFDCFARFKPDWPKGKTEENSENTYSAQWAKPR